MIYIAPLLGAGTVFLLLFGELIADHITRNQPDQED